MSILMGVMAVLMVVALVSGHRHMMGGHEKAQKQESMTHDAQKEYHLCNDCPAMLDKDGTAVNEESSDKNKSDAEVMR